MSRTKRASKNYISRARRYGHFKTLIETIRCIGRQQGIYECFERLQHQIYIRRQTSLQDPLEGARIALQSTFNQEEVELRNSLEGSSHHRLSTLPDIELRLSGTIYLVELFGYEILDGYESRTSGWLLCQISEGSIVF